MTGRAGITGNAHQIPLLHSFDVPVLHRIPCYGAEACKKNDVVYLRNGDKITCEVKFLSQGELTISHKRRLHSLIFRRGLQQGCPHRKRLAIRDYRPRRIYYIGTLTRDAAKHIVTVVSLHKTTLPQNSVFQVAELGTSFIKLLSGDISAGPSLTQSNSQKTLATPTNLKYQDEKRVFAVNSSSQFASQEKTKCANEITAKYRDSARLISRLGTPGVLLTSSRTPSSRLRIDGAHRKGHIMGEPDNQAHQR